VSDGFELELGALQAAAGRLATVGDQLSGDRGQGLSAAETAISAFTSGLPAGAMSDFLQQWGQAAARLVEGVHKDAAELRATAQRYAGADDASRPR